MLRGTETPYERCGDIFFDVVHHSDVGPYDFGL